MITAARALTDHVMRSLPSPIRKPFLNRIARVPAGYRATLWIKPGFHEVDDDVSVQSFEKVGDATESGFLGILLR